MRRGICRGWWCRCSGRLRRPGICSSRSGWSMPAAWWLSRRRRIFRELAACGRPAATHRSYGMDVLRWFRFLWAAGVCWDQATSAEARDFCCWIGLADKPVRPHWRYPGGGAPGVRTAVAPGTPNPVTGKRSPGRGYAAATVVHCESVLRGFYGFHLEAGTGPMVNPFPLARGRRGAGRTRITTRCSRSRPSALAGTGRSWPGGCRGRSRM